MRIVTTGRTRLVILTRRYAIKIAKFRVFYCALRVYTVLANRQVGERFATWRIQRGGILHVVLSAFFAGILANLAEYRRSRRYPACKLVCTTRTFLGLVNVQIRGDPAGSRDIRNHPVIRAARLWPELQLDLNPGQFCAVGSETLLADYGNPALEPVLASII